jgi:hypothetical protein
MPRWGVAVPIAGRLQCVLISGSSVITRVGRSGLARLGIVTVGGVLIFAGGMVGDLLRGVRSHTDIPALKELEAFLFVVLMISFIIASKNTLNAFGFGAGADVTQSEMVNGPTASNNS